MARISTIVRHPIRWLRSKWVGFRFARAYRLSRQGVRLLNRAHRIASPHLYGFERESYSAELVQLHEKIHEELRRQKREYTSFRYSYGYPYQGLSTLGVFGSRSTEDRWALYGLDKYIRADDRILDIGCNCGFMSLYSVFRTGCRATALDINPYMLSIGRHCAEVMRVSERITFVATDFAKLELSETYSVVYSFAAHHTDDAQHRPDLREYLERMHSLLEPGGLLVFESHGFDATNDTFQKTIWAVDDLFSIEEHKQLFDNTRELFCFRRV